LVGSTKFNFEKVLLRYQPQRYAKNEKNCRIEQRESIHDFLAIEATEKHPNIQIHKRKETKIKLVVSKKVFAKGFRFGKIVRENLSLNNKA
jgi:hypothetical protein